jgi:hypothetical protein
MEACGLIILSWSMAARRGDTFVFKGLRFMLKEFTSQIPTPLQSPTKNTTKKGVVFNKRSKYSKTYI